MEASKNFL